MKPRLLDLFCGAGGAAMGYHRAGFEVVGVDINPQPNYPFEFHQRNAIGVLMSDIRDEFDDFSVIHASPPCQRYSSLTKTHPGVAETHPELIDPTRQLLIAAGLPWIIENVPGAPLRADFILCGCMFGMRTRRPRWFETSWGNAEMNMPHDHKSLAMNPSNYAGQARIVEEFGKVPHHIPFFQDMGVEWMTRPEGREAIPPVFTEFIGQQLLQHLSFGAPVEGTSVQ